MADDLRLAVPRDARGERLDRFLGRALPGGTVARARALLEAGRVRIAGKVVRAERKLWGGEEVVVAAPPAARAEKVAPLPVLYEDDAVLVVDKPAGISVEPDGDFPSVLAWARAARPEVVVAGARGPSALHRLDRFTSGCLLLGKTDEAVLALEAAFRARTVEKRYLALVLGAPPETLALDTPYGRDPADPRRYSTKVRSARRATLEAAVRERFDGAALLDVRLGTGRTHQIRVQLADEGFAVLGDDRYGPEAARQHPAARALGRQALHAARLAFPSGGGRVEVEAPLPEDFARALALLRSPP